MSARTDLEGVLAPAVVDAIEQLVAERVRAELEQRTEGATSPWLAVDEAAAYLRVSKRTLERKLARGRVRSMSVGRRRLLHRADLDELARSGDGGGASANPLHSAAAGR